MTRSQQLLRLDLDAFVTTIDAAFAGTDDNVLLRLTGERPDLGLLRLDQQHPLDELLGFHAPASWHALGLHCAGWAQRIGDVIDVHSGDYTLASGPGGTDPVEIRFTMLVDRDGRGAGLMRDGPSTTRLSGMPEGLLGDACRRALGLPTTGPPPMTTELWLRIWLDRLVEAVAFDDDALLPRSFVEIAAVHPALLGSTAIHLQSGSATPTSPDELAEATLMLAAEWPWPRLRRDPAVVETEGPPLDEDLARWMDDGMFARWLLADVPPLDLLLDTAGQLLPLPTLHDIDDTVAACGLTAPEVQR